MQVILPQRLIILKGQTIPHSHVHIIPKIKGDEIKIGASEGIENKIRLNFLEREARTEEQMSEEASKYRDLFEQSVYLQ
jgi:diadenosine tetraphosphate (Ap4A) HIT family hydrolase